MKDKKCPVCLEQFQPTQFAQKCCGWKCAIEWGRIKKRKEDKKQTRKEKREFYAHDRKHQIKLAQQAFNAYIRERDIDEPCISCGKPDVNTNRRVLDYYKNDGQFHAGHFLTTGARSELRFHWMNCHKQCAPCNNHLSGNIIEYLPNLIAKIGKDNVDFLYNNQSKHKYTLEDITGIKEFYREQLKLLKQKRIE